MLIFVIIIGQHINKILTVKLQNRCCPMIEICNSTEEVTKSQINYVISLNYTVLPNPRTRT